MATDLASDRFWVDKCVYHDAERKYHESLAKLLRSGQKEVNKNGQKYEDSCDKKFKDSKNPKSQMKNQKSNLDDIQTFKKQIDHLEAKNAKNSLLDIIDPEKKECCEVIKDKEDTTVEKDLHMKDLDKKLKQKDAKEKKNKSEKKSKKIRDKEEKKMGGVGMANMSQESFPKTWLAGEVAKARQHIKSSLKYMDGIVASTTNYPNKPQDADATTIAMLCTKFETALKCLELRVEALEKTCAANSSSSKLTSTPSQTVKVESKKDAKDDDDDVDLFGSESEEEDDNSKKIREQRLAEYAAKKSKKPELIAKSNIILDVKPWDDETDMKKMEEQVRAVQMEGLIWGASKLVPLAFGIYKLQISCVVEDDKVSVDALTETLETIEEYVQSVDIAAFNKV